MALVELFGIANCDTMKKARRWLDAEGVAYRFHDYRKEGLDSKMLAIWVERLGWEVLLNKRGTTWRKLSDAERADLDTEKAITLMLAHPAMIKRPVLVMGDEIEVGYSPEQYEQLQIS
ncbi:ArsC family reductase [Mariprofundus ferrooxydans]|uniref:ArsC family reductase n=1 Tax=Mariprofundus ferrooxydans TaxID=314344 RepID=UPI0019815AE9|nr:ArsC family reductase [Mariprofundus ferrooxydans]